MPAIGQTIVDTIPPDPSDNHADPLPSRFTPATTAVEIPPVMPTFGTDHNYEELEEGETPEFLYQEKLRKLPLIY